jgi:hypothetical protein
MELTIRIDPTWLAHADPLGRILDHIRALEGPAPYAPPAPAREPGCDDDSVAGDDQGDDLGVLLDGLEGPEPAAVTTPPPASKPMPGTGVAPQISGSAPPPRASTSAPAPTSEPRAPAAVPAPPWCGPPQSGQALYRWACNAKILPRVNAIGKARGWHRLVTHWDADQVAAAFTELTEGPAVPTANGRPR